MVNNMPPIRKLAMNRMSFPAAFAAVLVSLSLPVAGAESMHAMEHDAATAASSPLVDALVMKVDKKAGLITLAHGPLPNGMPAMTMAFRVKEAVWLEHLKGGDKIRFAAEEVNGGLTVVRFEPGR